MPSAPNPRTWVDDEIPPFSTIDAEVYSTLNFLLQPPMCKVRQTTSQSVANVSFVPVTMQTEDIDPWNWHNATVNPSRVTPTFPGWYRGWYSVCFAGTTGGNYRLGYAVKNSAIQRSRRDSKTNTVGNNKAIRGVPFYYEMNGTTDYVEVWTYQDSGAAMSLPVTGILYAELFLRWWAPL